jgi:hypothetical protein
MIRRGQERIGFAAVHGFILRSPMASQPNAASLLWCGWRWCLCGLQQEMLMRQACIIVPAITINMASAPGTNASGLRTCSPL